jgi:MHS family shikimate/dehydroshikimate transporter-like MFS transporter
MPKVAAASFAGAMLEWYDFFIFGIASALVLGPLFFPGRDPVVGMMASFATGGVGFLARPLGAIVFGHMGDHVGRKSTLIATLLIIGLGTFFIGFLPTYTTAGPWAAVALVVLRLVQGFGIGGEYGGAALMTIEHAPKGKRGFWGGFPQSGSPGGILLATGAFALVSLLHRDALLSWGWRIPFLLSGPMLAVGLFIRMNVTETPDFERARAAPAKGLTVVALFREHPSNTLLALGARLAETTSSNVINPFCLAYVATQLAMGRTIPLIAVLLASTIAVFMCPVFGLLGDRIGQRSVYVLAAGFMAAFAFPFFMLLGTKITLLVVIAIILAFNLGTMMMFSVEATFFSQLFNARVRYTGLSVAFQVSAIVGGFTPLISTYLLKRTDGAPWLVAGFLCAISVLSLVCAAVARPEANELSPIVDGLHARADV